MKKEEAAEGPRFVYEVLVRNAPSEPGGLGTWNALGHGNQVADTQLFGFLNALGADGWEVIAVGDIGFGSSNEILLKKEIVGEPETPAPVVPERGIV